MPIRSILRYARESMRLSPAAPPRHAGHRRPVVEAMEGRTMMNALTPDAAFGTGGRVTIDGFGGMDVAYALAVRDDGRMLVGGMVTHPDGDRSGALVRLNADGSRDTTFGTNGIAVVAPGVLDSIYALHLAPDGSILAGGTHWGGGFGGGQAAVARFNPDGSLDTTFGGGDGFVAVETGLWAESVHELAVAPDGKLIALASGDAPDDDGDFTVLRLTADGTLDATFGGGDGIVTTDFSDATHSADRALTIAFAPDGKLIVAGGTVDYYGEHLDWRHRGFALARYNDDGSLDETFGDGGRVVTAFAPDPQSWNPSGYGTANDVVVTADGKLLVVGYSTAGSLTVVRYNADGSLDATYGGGDGIVHHKVTGIHNTAQWQAGLLDNGELGGAAAESVAAAARLDADGNLLDLKTQDLPYNQAGGTAATLLPDGDLLVIGHSAPRDHGYNSNMDWWATVDMAAWRFDTGFGGGFDPAPVPPEPAPEPEPQPLPIDDGGDGESTPPEPLPAIELQPVVEASVSGKGVVRSGRFYTFKAVFQSDAAIDVSALGGMEVAGPNGYSDAADATRVKVARGGTRVTVTYRMAAPGGSFDASDNGAYTIWRTDAATGPQARSLPPSAAALVVADGNAGGTVGAFQVMARSRRGVAATAPTPMVNAAPPVPAADATVAGDAAALLDEQR